MLARAVVRRSWCAGGLRQSVQRRVSDRAARLTRGVGTRRERSRVGGYRRILAYGDVQCASRRSPALEFVSLRAWPCVRTVQDEGQCPTPIRDELARAQIVSNSWSRLARIRRPPILGRRIWRGTGSRSRRGAYGGVLFQRVPAGSVLAATLPPSGDGVNQPGSRQSSA